MGSGKTTSREKKEDVGSSLEKCENKEKSEMDACANIKRLLTSDASVVQWPCGFHVDFVANIGQTRRLA